jgi:hypothetical protein
VLRLSNFVYPWTFTHTYIALHGYVERADLLTRDMTTGEYVLKTEGGG